MPLYRHMPGGPSRTRIEVKLPGTLGNDNLYAHGLGGPDTHKNVFYDVVLTKKPGEFKAELRFKHLNVTSPTSGSSTGKLRNYFTPVIQEIDLRGHVINFIIPEGALVVPSMLTQYDDSLLRPSSTNHYSAAAVTIDFDSFDNHVYYINLINYGTILGAGGVPAKRRVWSYVPYSAGSDFGLSANPNDHEQWLIARGAPDGGGRRIVPSIDGGSAYGLNDMGFPDQDQSGMFGQFASQYGTSTKTGSIGLPTDPIVLMGTSFTNIMFKIYNKSTGKILAGGGAGGGGPIQDLDLGGSVNNGKNYVAEMWGNQTTCTASYPSYCSVSFGFIGWLRDFPNSTTNRVPYRVLVGGGYGGWGAGWHYNYGADEDVDTVFKAHDYDSIGIRKDGPFGHHRTEPTNKGNTINMWTWDPNIPDENGQTGSPGYKLNFGYYPYFSWLSNRRGYEALAYEGGPDGNPFGILNKGGIPSTYYEGLDIGCAISVCSINPYPDWFIGWPYAPGITVGQPWTNPRNDFAGMPGASPGVNFQKNAGANGFTQTQENLGGNGATYAQNGIDATDLTYKFPNSVDSSSPESNAYFVNSGIGVGGKAGKSVTVRWFSSNGGNGLTNQSVHTIPSERLGYPYASIVENLGEISGESEINFASNMYS